MSSSTTSQRFDNPLDNIGSASSRFAIELGAWIAGPWAAAELAGSWIAIIPALAILVALPGVFSVIGDKRHVVVAVPGRVRLAIELILAAVAIYSAFLVWSPIGGIAVIIITTIMFVAGFSRARWLLSNEPPSWISHPKFENRK